MRQYSVKKLAELSGVSVRTLHYYDQIGLLSPAVRSGAGYRQYGEAELLRLQQILFYKTLDFSLKEIKSLLDSPEFDLINSLEQHKKALQDRAEYMKTLLQTLTKTIDHLKKGTMLDYETLYEGLPADKIEPYRQEARENWGEAFERSERHLSKMQKGDLQNLKKDFDICWRKLASMCEQGASPSAAEVQAEIAMHYQYIRQFWGTADRPDPQVEAYIGLADMYIADPRFTSIDGKQVLGFGEFLKEAIQYFVHNSMD